jgi:hypothetical protein
VAQPKLKIGSRWRSVVSDTEVVIVRPPTGEEILTCGGTPMVPIGDPITPVAEAPELADDEPTLIGKRYHDGSSGLQVLCSKGGKGRLRVSGRALEIAGAKPLPSSD